MSILSCQGGHDATIAIAEGHDLISVVEAEQDSYPRYSNLNPFQALVGLEAAGTSIPETICLPGWIKGFFSREPSAGAGYFGLTEPIHEERVIFGMPVTVFSGTHERSHIFCATGMSPFESAPEITVLIWEGNIGGFYVVDRSGKILRSQHVLTDPGNKYQFPFNLADPEYPATGDGFRFEAAGKMMALAAFGDPDRVGEEGRALLADINGCNILLRERTKLGYGDSAYFDCGLESAAFADLAALQTRLIFTAFADVAEREGFGGRPLVIAGGCGLNVTWNTWWWDSGIFTDVFVPPVPGDHGVAIGSIADYLTVTTGERAHLSWSVYAGSPFNHDVPVPTDYAAQIGMAAMVADLAAGEVVAFVQGRCEIGPRSLGHRSLLAYAADPGAKDRLNAVKRREDYRPIAPLCRERDAPTYFEGTAPAEHMLFTRLVRDRRLAAVTHVDGSARLQTVDDESAGHLSAVFAAMADAGLVPVLCNTSLNFKGRGFVNRVSDLAAYAAEQDLVGYAIDGTYYRRGR